MLIDKIQDKKYMTYISYLLFSYLLFVGIVGVFGKGFSALSSFIIVMSSCAMSIFLIIYLLRDTLFRRIDYIIIGLVFLLQTLIGAFHFIFIINPDYFIENITGVDIENGHYYWDIFYFTYLIDSIAEYWAENGFLSINLIEGAVHKNYMMAFIASGIFYFGDSYVLNFSAINILSIFYSGILLALLASKIFDSQDINKIRPIFYFTILQPFAWIPSHSMRDIFGVFLIILSISLIYFSITKAQKAISYIISIGLVFQHRSVYILSIIGSLLIRNVFAFNKKNGLIMLFISSFMAFFIIQILGSDIFSIFINIFNTSQENSLLSDVSSSILEHFIKLMIGPFPWTQYFDGTVTGYAGHYSTIIILQASWHLTILYILIKNIKNILISKDIRHFFYIIYYSEFQLYFH